jgi:hypothetical protein
MDAIIILIMYRILSFVGVYFEALINLAKISIYQLLHHKNQHFFLETKNQAANTMLNCQNYQSPRGLKKISIITYYKWVVNFLRSFV